MILKTGHDNSMTPQITRFFLLLGAFALSLIFPGCASIAPKKTEPADAALNFACDPNNFPFSSQEEAGFENKIATLIANALGKNELKFIWWSQKRGFIKNTLNATDKNFRADIIVGTAKGIARVATTDAYYRSSYVMVYRDKEPKLSLANLDDPQLKTLKIGIHVLGDDYENPPPAQALANRGITKNVSGYSTIFSHDNPPSKIIDDLEKGVIDVVIAWGPSVGYFVKNAKSPLTMHRLIGSKFDPPFTFEISMAVNETDDKLRDSLNSVIAKKKEEIKDILENYGVPLY